MRILHIINSMDVGGTEKSLLKILKNDCWCDDEMMIVVLRGEGKLSNSFRSAGYQILHVNLRRSPFAFLRLFRVLREILKFKPDIVQGWLYHSDLVAGILGLFLKTPVFWSIRQSNVSAKHNKLFTYILIRLCAMLSNKLPKLVISNSAKAKISHTKIGYKERDIIVIPNGFEIRGINNKKIRRNCLRQEKNLPKDSKLVGMIGRFNSQKNHIGFLNAAKIILEKMPDVHFVFAGEGVDDKNQAIKLQLENMNLPRNRFVFLGCRDDVQAIMEELDILALPSHGESFPTVVGEAMLKGTPCVATNVGDCIEIIGDSGKIVDVDDMKRFAEETINLLRLRKGELSMLGLKAQKRIEALYNINSTAKLYRNVYSEFV